MPGVTLAFVVDVVADEGLPQGQTVTFSVSPDDGTVSLSPISATTGEGGLAQTTLTIGSDASGSYTVTATLNDGISVSGTVTVDAASPPPPPLRTLVMFSDNLGFSQPGDSVTFTAEVGEGGSPVQGQTVTFSVNLDNGTASLNPTSATADNNGRAQTTLTLGSSASGSYTVTASVGTSAVNTIVEVVEPEISAPQQQQSSSPTPMPTALAVILDDNQSSLTGEGLPNPFVVEVRDQYGDPVGGVPVTFAVSAGDGMLSDTTVTTDAYGQAESTLILGSAPGTNTVEASVEGISQMVVFSAEAILPPPMPTALSIISGDNQSGLTGEALANPFVIEVRDQYGDPMEGVTVTFVVSAGGGSLSDTSVDTDVNGLVQSTLTLGNDPGTNTVTASVEGIAEMATFNAVAELLEFDLSLPASLSLIHIPLKVRAIDGMVGTIESVGALYAALGGADTVNFLITLDPTTQEWLGYFGASDTGTSVDRELTKDMGILAGMIAPVSVRLGGDALGTDGSSTITLNQGLNLVGLPLKDSRVTRVSDLFALAGIADNVPVIIVSDNGEFKAVGRAGDPSDIEITGGQSFILTAQQAATVTISGDAWDNTASGMMAAPPIAMRGIQTTEVTPVLALNGSIVDGVRGISSAGLRVTVKNLSTGGAVTTAVGDIGSTSSRIGYRLTVVDITDGRAAAIGDTLEISVKSTDASIGVQPLRYTLTVEDVRLSRVELPALFLHEIPVETELLRNYPNPFNPETWIPYRLAQDAFVTLTIYDGNGQMVRTLDVGHQTAAVYENRSRAAYWDGRNYVGESVASGVYFYTLTAGDFSATRKMVILK